MRYEPSSGLRSSVTMQTRCALAPTATLTWEGGGDKPLERVNQHYGRATQSHGSWPGMTAFAHPLAAQQAWRQRVCGG